MAATQQVKLTLSAMLLAAGCIASSAQATVVKFEGLTGVNSAVSATARTIDGMAFSFSAGVYYMQNYHSADSNAPLDPTGSLFLYANNTFNMAKAGGGAFSLNSFEAGRYLGQANGVVSVTGTLVGGGAIGTTFNLTQNSFERFTFGSNWNNLQQVSFRMTGTPYVQYDNIVYNATAVPEPSTAALALLALGVLGFARRRGAQRKSV